MFKWLKHIIDVGQIKLTLFIQLICSSIIKINETQRNQLILGLPIQLKNQRKRGMKFLTKTFARPVGSWPTDHTFGICVSGILFLSSFCCFWGLGFRLSKC
jgi:hypothetical protein